MQLSGEHAREVTTLADGTVFAKDPLVIGIEKVQKTDGRVTKEWKMVMLNSQW